MKEELYITHGGQRYKIDLESPSGITFRFNSNLLNDLSKIDCSKSYTFKVPRTVNNSNAFDMIEDLRRDSSVYGKSFEAEYLMNGIVVCNHGYLYVEKAASDSYNAVLTWNVMKGLIVIREEGGSLRGLGTGLDNIDYTESNFGAADSTFSNAADVLYPVYHTGVTTYRESREVGDVLAKAGEFGGFNNTGSNDKNPEVGSSRLLPLPVVPIKSILEKIKSKYGIAINLCNEASGVVPADTNNVLDYGGVPLVKTSTTDEQYEAWYSTLTGNVSVHSSDFDGCSHVLGWMSATKNENSAFSSILTHNSTSVGYEVNISGATIRARGMVYLGFDSMYVDDALDEIELQFIGKYGSGEEQVLASVTPYQYGYDSTKKKYIYAYNLLPNEGYSEADLGKIRRFTHIFVRVPKTATPVSSVGSWLKLYTYYEEGAINHKIDLWKTLPDISVTDFVKSLFFIAGGYPKIIDSSTIGITYFTEFGDNVTAGNVYDWSGKVLTEYEELSFSAGEFVRNNYYLMKNENLDERGKKKEVDKDGYNETFAHIECKNANLDTEKAIVQLPFNAKYIKDGKNPLAFTGNTIKYYSKDIESRLLTAEEAPPAIGLFCSKELRLVTTIYDTEEIELQDGTIVENSVPVDFTEATESVLSFKVWEWGTLTDNPQYAYLKSLIEKPRVIKVKMKLDEWDLSNIDYAKPVYLSRFSSYFAIIEITYNSNTGLSTAELIKLPI